MILRLNFNKQLDGKTNGIIEIFQEIISELCSIQEWGDFTWRLFDCEELVCVLLTVDGRVLIKFDNYKS